MILVHNALPHAGDALSPVVAICVERRQLAKRLWRGIAADGLEFGFDLAAPLAHGDLVHVAAAGRYVIRQEPEPVLEIPLPSAPEAAAITGWAVGNLHFPIEAQAHRLLAPDDVALRQSLERLGLPFRPVVAVFQPHRLAAGAAPHGATAGDHPFIFKPLTS